MWRSPRGARAGGAGGRWSCRYTASRAGWSSRRRSTRARSGSRVTGLASCCARTDPSSVRATDKGRLQRIMSLADQQLPNCSQPESTMQAFTKVTGIVAPLPRVNVDTDQILPAQFLKRIERTGFGEFAFYDWRYLADGSPNPEFELNRPGYEGATILVAGRNFGCGSSPHHPPPA